MLQDTKRKGLRGSAAAVFTAAAFIMAAFIVAASLTGCRASEKPQKKPEAFTIGVVTKLRSSEYWMSVSSGMDKAAEDFGVTVVIVSPDSETDVKVQEKMIDDLLEKGVDALAVAPIQSYNVSEYLEKADSKGIPVYSYDTLIVSPGVPYIGIDNEKAGRDLAKAMVEMLGGQGTVGIISGNLDQTPYINRAKGFKEYIEANSDIEIAFEESGYSMLRVSENKIRMLLEQNPKVDGIFAASAVTALGIMEYIQDDSVVIMTVDAQQDTLEAVRNGKIRALAAQSGYDIGYETIRYIVNDRDGVSQPEQKILETRIITKDSIDRESQAEPDSQAESGS